MHPPKDLSRINLRLLDTNVAVEEFTQMIQHLEAAGLHTEVRAGYDQSLLVFIQAPRELLGNMVYHSR